MKKNNKQLKSISPLVSVIIPTFNRAKMVKKAIESVLIQDYKNIEILVVDDGSTDNTRKVIESINNSKIKYIYQKNQGRSNARNHALRLANGKYIAFLDSDDIFLPGKITKQVNILEHNKRYDMVYTSADAIKEDGKQFNKYYTANASGWIYDKIAFYLPLTVILPTVMVERMVFKKVGNFDEDMNRFEDTDMWRRISKHYQVYAIKESTCQVYSHFDNRMEEPEKLYNSIDYYVRKIFKEDKNKPTIFKKKGASFLYLHYAKAIAGHPKYKKSAKKFLDKAFYYWPFNPQLYIYLLVSKLKKNKRLYNFLRKKYRNNKFLVKIN